MICTLLLAAGASSRMRGGDKLLEPVDGVPLLQRQASMALEIGPVVVAVAPDRPKRRDVLELLGVHIVVVTDATEGMGVSIRAGVGALPQDASGVLILPGDMPDIDAAALREMALAHGTDPDRVWRGSSNDGTPGHPVLFPKRLFPALLDLHGDEGARSVLKNEHVGLVSLPGQAALTDLDTPEAWAAWRRDRESR